LNLALCDFRENIIQTKSVSHKLQIGEMDASLSETESNAKCQTRKHFLSREVKFCVCSRADHFLAVFQPDILHENDKKCRANNEAEKLQSKKHFGHSDALE
jgi:hypothetical protein